MRARKSSSVRITLTTRETYAKAARGGVWGGARVSGGGGGEEEKKGGAKDNTWVRIGRSEVPGVGTCSALADRQREAHVRHRPRQAAV